MVASVPVVVFDKVDQVVVDSCTVWEPEGGSRRKVVEEDEFLLLHYTSVVTFFSLCVYGAGSKKEKIGNMVNE